MSTIRHFHVRHCPVCRCPSCNVESYKFSYTRFMSVIAVTVTVTRLVPCQSPWWRPCRRFIADERETWKGETQGRIRDLATSARSLLSWLAKIWRRSGSTALQDQEMTATARRRCADYKDSTPTAVERASLHACSKSDAGDGRPCRCRPCPRNSL